MRPLPAGTCYLAPRSVHDAVVMRADHPDGLYVAGGTDLYYNLKSGLGPERPILIDLTRLPYGFRGTTFEPSGEVSIGSLTTLEMLGGGFVRSRLPALAEAAQLVAAPQHQEVGTIGGNVALDTRCWYYNQDAQWRESLGGCLKAEGDTCHVTGSRSRCVARRAGDTVAPLLLYGAFVEYETLEGRSRMPLADVLTDNGMFGPHVGLQAGAFIRSVSIPSQSEGFAARYVKIAPRRSIDFPLISLAIGARFVSNGCEEVTVVVSSVRPRPRVMRFRVEGCLTPDRIAEIAHTVEIGVKPMTNVHGSPSFQKWRARVVGVHVSRVLSELAAARG